MPNPSLPIRAREHSPLVLADPVSFARGRVHEICGPARRVLAAQLAGLASMGEAHLPQAVIWAVQAWDPTRLCPYGLMPVCPPERIIRVACGKPVDLLWTLEEALRSGAVALAVAEFAEPPGLTPVRRLQLAAEAGGLRGTGLLLTPGDGGAPGVESRWHIASRGPKGGWRLERLRARMAPEAAFDLVVDPAAPGCLVAQPTAPPESGPAV